jgi:hypothetical protein
VRRAETQAWPAMSAAMPANPAGPGARKQHLGMPRRRVALGRVTSAPASPACTKSLFSATTYSAFGSLPEAMAIANWPRQLKLRA